MYFILPETENRTLEDIERHFGDNSKKITDHKITKSKPRKKVQTKCDVENGENSMKKPLENTIPSHSDENANVNWTAAYGYQNEGFEREQEYKPGNELRLESESKEECSKL